MHACVCRSLCVSRCTYVNVCVCVHVRALRLQLSYREWQEWMPTCACLPIGKSNKHGAVCRHKWWSVHVRPPDGVGIHHSLPWLFLEKKLAVLWLDWVYLWQLAFPAGRCVFDRCVFSLCDVVFNEHFIGVERSTLGETYTWATVLSCVWPKM